MGTPGENPGAAADNVSQKQQQKEQLKQYQKMADAAKAKQAQKAAEKAKAAEKQKAPEKQKAAEKSTRTFGAADSAKGGAGSWIDRSSKENKPGDRRPGEKTTSDRKQAGATKSWMDKTKPGDGGGIRTPAGDSSARSAQDRDARRPGFDKTADPYVDMLRKLPTGLPPGWSQEAARDVLKAVDDVSRQFGVAGQSSDTGSGADKRTPRPFAPQADLDVNRERRHAQEQRGRKDFAAVMKGKSELSRALEDVGERNVKDFASQNKEGIVPVVIATRQKLFVRDQQGRTLGNVGEYWRGAQGTERPSTNLAPGTYVADIGSGVVYAYANGNRGERAGRLRQLEARSSDEALSTGHVDLFCNAQTPHRKTAFNEAVKKGISDDRGVLMIRVPQDQDMMPMNAQEDGKSALASRDALGRVGGEIKKSLESLVDHPVEAGLMVLTGIPGLMDGGLRIAANAGESKAIARGAETRDEIEIAAGIYAGAVAETAVLIGTAVAAKGAVKGVKALSGKLSGATSLGRDPGMADVGAEVKPREMPRPTSDSTVSSRPQEVGQRPNAGDVAQSSPVEPPSGRTVPQAGGRPGRRNRPLTEDEISLREMETFRGSEAGKTLERFFAEVGVTSEPNPKKPGTRYSVDINDPKTGGTKTVNVEPDFMPKGEVDAKGRNVFAENPADALVIADSKFKWERNNVTLDDQLRGMLTLAKNHGKPFVFLVKHGGGISKGVQKYANKLGVKIGVVEAPSLVR